MTADKLNKLRGKRGAQKAQIEGSGPPACRTTTKTPSVIQNTVLKERVCIRPDIELNNKDCNNNTIRMVVRTAHAKQTLEYSVYPGPQKSSALAGQYSIKFKYIIRIPRSY